MGGSLGVVFLQGATTGGTDLIARLQGCIQIPSVYADDAAAIPMAPRSTGA